MPAVWPPLPLDPSSEPHFLIPTTIYGAGRLFGTQPTSGTLSLYVFLTFSNKYPPYVALLPRRHLRRPPPPSARTLQRLTHTTIMGSGNQEVEFEQQMSRRTLRSNVRPRRPMTYVPNMSYASTLTSGLDTHVPNRHQQSRSKETYLSRDLCSIIAGPVTRMLHHTS